MILNTGQNDAISLGLQCGCQTTFLHEGNTRETHVPRLSIQRASFRRRYCSCIVTKDPQAILPSRKSKR